MKKVKLDIIQGATFTKALYWYDGDERIVPITAIGQDFPAGYPAVITAAAHLLPANAVPAQLVGIEGPTELNTDPEDPLNLFRYVKKIDADTAQILGINAQPLTDYVGNGYLVYVPPKNLTGYKARLQIRKSVSAVATLLELTTENGGITLTDAEGLIELFISAADTALLTFAAAVYDLEMVLPGVLPADDIVARIAFGDVSLSKETTR